MGRLLVAAALLSALPALPGQSSPADLNLKAKGLCLDIERVVNDLLLKKPESVKCIPAGGRIKGSVSLILVYQLPWFSTPTSRKAVLVTSMLASGSVLRKNSSLKVDEIIVSDVEQMKNYRAYKFPGDAAMRIQRRVQSDQIDWEKGYLELTPDVQQVTIPTTKRP